MEPRCLTLFSMTTGGKPSHELAFPQLLRGPSLRREALDHPALALAAIAEAVVQPAGAALPELDPLRHDAVAAPVVGEGDRSVAVELLQPGELDLQRLPVGDDLALMGEVGADAAAGRPRIEIGLRLLA